ncbi:hypothetical protein [Clostridium sp.]|uniref:hypothetical protein n=1 Tax=Clostridium sp. TaxID=1506 RepID=UPI0032173FD8
MAGWQKVYRDIQKHWLWEDKPFSRGQAFIDLILLVNHQDGKILFEGDLVEVKRGSRITSLRKLGEAWGWSSKKVKKFLEQLEKDKMISYKSDNKKTLVTIENYSLYQDVGNTEETQEKQEGNSEETVKHFRGNSEEFQRKTNKKDKEYIKNEEEEKECKQGEEGEEIVPSHPHLSFSTPYHEVIYNQWGEITYKTWFTTTEIEDKDSEIFVKSNSDFMVDIINQKFKKSLDILFSKSVTAILKE